MMLQSKPSSPERKKEVDTFIKNVTSLYNKPYLKKTKQMSKLKEKMIQCKNAYQFKFIEDDIYQLVSGELQGS